MNSKNAKMKYVQFILSGFLLHKKRLFKTSYSFFSKYFFLNQWKYIMDNRDFELFAFPEPGWITCVARKDDNNDAVAVGEAKFWLQAKILSN